MPWIVRLRRLMVFPTYRYAFALFVGGVALALSIYFPGFVRNQPFFFFFPAVVVGSSVSGFGPGVLIILMCIVGLDRLVFSLPGTWSYDAQTFLRLSLFALVSLLITWVCEMHRRAETALTQSEDRLKGQVQLAALVSDISMALTTHDDVSLMLKVCSDALVRHLDISVARLWSIDDTRGVLLLQASSGPYEHFDSALLRVPIGQHEVGRIAYERLPHLTNNIGDSQSSDFEWARREKMVGFAGYPLLVADELVGVMALFSRQPITPESHRTIASVANSLALGVKRKETEQALQELNKSLEQNVLDRTEQLREKESELHQARKMEAIGRLAGGVAHDFNNMLTGILGCSESLEEIVTDPEGKIEIAEIRKAAERAGALTKQLLAFSRRQVMRPQAVQINELITETSKLLARLIGEDVRLDIHLDPTLERVLADPGQLDQVVMNIALNARDAMPTGGVLRIDTSNITVEADTPHVTLMPGCYVMVAISDTGVGMSQQTQSRIFEPFFTTKDQGKGTGLGLATADGVVKQMNGTILVYSHEGIGSTFKVLLPQLPVNADMVSPEPDPKEAEPTSTGSETILVVEDEPLVSAYIGRMLRRRGYHVIAAAHPEEALNIVKTTTDIDMVLTDVVMPGMNGRDMMKIIHSSEPEMRTLYMSGYPHEIISQKGILDPTIAFISKPFYSHALYTKIKTVLEEKA